MPKKTTKKTTVAGGETKRRRGRPAATDAAERAQLDLVSVQVKLDRRVLGLARHVFVALGVSQAAGIEDALRLYCSEHKQEAKRLFDELD